MLSPESKQKPFKFEEGDTVKIVREVTGLKDKQLYIGQTFVIKCRDCNIRTTYKGTNKYTNRYGDYQWEPIVIQDGKLNGYVFFDEELELVKSVWEINNGENDTN